MSDDEMEKFEITDNDLNHEFYRSRKKLTKHQQIYGVWADSDNEEDKRPSFKKTSRPKGYTAPIVFLAGGVQQAGKTMTNKDGVKNEKQNFDHSDDEKPTTSFKTRESSDSEEEPARAGFGGFRPQSTQATVTEITGDIAGLRRKPTGANIPGVGNWGKHSIAAKLMLKMGFQPGKGLGKDLQGIPDPIEAHPRKGRGAIGAYGPEKPASILKKKELNQEIIVISDDEDKRDGSKWKKGDMAKKRTRYHYRSVDDVIQKGKFKRFKPGSELTKVLVIDLTGPQQRMLSGYHALSDLKAPPEVEQFEDVVHKKCAKGKHSKAAQLMLKMGFQPGKGLGKDLQGIPDPIEAHPRKGRGAIGAYGPEKPASILKKKELNQEIIVISDDEDKRDGSKWKKGDMAKKRTRYHYRSVDDVIQKGKFKRFKPGSELTKVLVIDLTGPQQRMLSGYHALSDLKAPPEVEQFEDVVHKKCAKGKHSKAAQLMLKMGFQPGKGLGKDLQGIPDPVEAHPREGREAIGAYGPEKPASIPKKKELNQEIVISDDEDKRDESKLKKGDMAKKKTRYYYRSVDDVIQKGKFERFKPGSELTKVIDLTEPQQRVLSGYHALSGLEAPPGVEHFEDVVHKKCANFALPEIQHNLNVLVDMCEQDIIRIDKNTRYCQDRIVNMKQEQETIRNQMIEEDELMENLRDVMVTVDELIDPSQGLSLMQVAQIFNDLQDRHCDEYFRCELGELAPGLVGPLLTSALANWSPLTAPKQYLDVFSQWKDILDKPRQCGTLEGNMGIQPYDSLLWHTWMPVMRTCVSLWNPKDCDPLITLIETWMHLLPGWVLDNFYDQSIMPKILAEVNAWNPLTDTIPIHVWIHPWMPLLDTRLQSTIYPIIQEKLGVALTNWHPSDRSVKPMLKPWQRALPERAFVAFLIKHIVPKLQLCMQSLVINPREQHLDAWHWVMDWSDMLSVGNMTLILDKFFFPRWRQTLAMWLNDNPNYAQVTEWYSGWKSMLSDELLAQPTIKENFHNALEIMSRAVNLGQQPGAEESISYLTSMKNNGPPPPPPPSVESLAQAMQTASEMPLSYKDLVAKRCEERGILFVPIPNKYREAKQVYRLGSNGVQCYIDRNVVFSSQNNIDWAPTSLNRLLDMV